MRKFFCRIYGWMRREPGTAVGLAVGICLLIGIAVLEVNEQRKLQGVEVVGPCRTFGPDNPECRRQSRKIIRSCLTHRDCTELVSRLIARGKRKGLFPSDEEDKPPTNTGAGISPPLKGGGTQTQAPPPSQQPAPGNGGASVGDADGNDAPPNSPPPTAPPAPPPADPPRDTSLLGPTVDGVCGTVQNLNLNLC